MSSIFLIFPNQLYEDTNALKGYDAIYILEEPIYFYDAKWRPIKPNKVKIAFLRAAMRQYYESLRRNHRAVHYIEYSDLRNKKTYRDILGKPSAVTFYDPTDHALTEKLAAYLEGAQSTTKDSPNFLLTTGDLKTIKVSRHAAFYEEMKRRLGLFVGVESQDKLNRLPPPAEATDDERLEEVYTSGAVYEEALRYAAEVAGDHCGDGRALALYPTNAADAKRALRIFIAQRLKKFGPYEDAIMEESPFMYHSVVSAALNAGLLDIREVVAAVAEADGVPLNSREGLVRQLIGWREYMRYLYVTRYEVMMNANTYKSKRRISAEWYEGTTGMRPLDMEIQKALYYGYSHHIVRLMVFLSVLVMQETDPRDVYKWFMEVVAIDAYDWVMIGNIWAMGYYYSGAMTRPYLSGANYIVKMSNYERDGVWDVAWDRLFHRFVDKHRVPFYWRGAK